MRRYCVALAMAAIAVSALDVRAYEDAYLAIAGDESVRTNWVGNRVVYVFTNTASVVSATFRQKMTLEEALLVGGGGAGGGFHGGGGGGGGVLDLTARTFCPESAQISLMVGKGGAVNGNGVGKPGSPSSVTIGGVTSTALGGGGGGCGTSSLPSTGSNGSGGGASCPNGSGAVSVLANADEYTSGQGNPGGNNPGKAKAGGGGGYSERGHDGAAFSVSEDKSVTGICGDGGEGLTNAITGVKVVYGSGGGGGGGTSNFGVTWAGKGGTNAGDGGQGRLSQNPDAATASSSAGRPAPAGFGGGGGGGGAFKENGLTAVAQRAGGAGGSGTVILSFTVGGEPGKPVIEQKNVVFTFPDDESQPFFNVTLTGEEGAAYSATVKVYCGTGALAQAGEVYQSTNSFTGIANGGSVEGFAFVYPRPDETFFVKIVASAEAVEDTVFTTSLTVPSNCRVPSHVGKGGGAGVIHVRPGARGRGTGANWSDAYTDFRAALKEISAERPELWFCGDEGMNSAMTVTVAPPVAAAIRGGFAGVETTRDERVSVARSRIDGGKTYSCFTFNTAQELVLDGFDIERGASYGISKTGSGNVLVTNCVIGSSPVAISLTGTKGVTEASVVDSVVTNCGAGTTSAAISSTKLKSLRFSDTKFLSCGYATDVAFYTTIDRRVGSVISASEIPVGFERCAFIGCYGGGCDKDSTGGIIAFRGTSAGSVMRNCVLAWNVSFCAIPGNTGYRDTQNGVIVVKLNNAADSILLENCTFAHNLFEGWDSTPGINVITGTANITNCVFAGGASGPNVSFAPYHLRVQNGAKANVGHSLFEQPLSLSCLAAASDGIDYGPGVISDVNPYLVTSEDATAGWRTTSGNLRLVSEKLAEIYGFDCHLLSTAGYRTNDGRWHEDGTVNSPAIDKGDPEYPVGDEEEPNGGIVNMGAYGGTAEASKTSMVTPEFDGPVVISFLGETSQPKIIFKLGGSTPYTADADVFISTDGSTWTKVGDTLFGCANDGTTYEVVVMTCYEKGTTLYAKVELKSSSATVSGQTDEGVEVTYDKHPSWGKGGGAGVIHVRAGATGDGSGSDWFNAMANLREAFARFSADESEIWFCGDEAANSLMAVAFAPAAAAAIRGGFAGTECSPAERIAGARSVIDGEASYTCLTVQNAMNLTVDGFCFTRGKARGLTKTGAGDIVVTNCTFDANGLTSGTVAGRAMDLSGETASTRATVADCTIVNHRESSNNGTAGALYLHALASAAVSDTLFASNGLAFGTIPYYSGQAGRFSSWGEALAVDGVATVVERCDFRVNLALTGNLNGSIAGGVVMFRGDSGGSVVRNCVFAGNVSQHTQATSFTDSDGGALVFKMTDAAETASVENCTFYRNLFEGLNGTAALNVLSGSVEVKNSIFCANLTGVNNAGAIADIRVRDGAAATVAYSMFGALAASTNDLGGTLSFGQGVTTNDPCFVTSLEDLGQHTTTGKSGVTYVIFPKTSQNALCAIDCHLRKRSPAIDAGDPKSPYRNETVPNGWRVNLGAYGNTPWAALSREGTLLKVR